MDLSSEALTTEKLRYPIGRFEFRGEVTAEERGRFTRQLRETPSLLRRAVQGLSRGQLDTPYRPGGWTVRGVVHHLPDSHLNSYVRFKLALTEEEPLIKPYDERRWAELEDSRDTPLEVSLTPLEALHERWVVLLGSLSSEDLARSFRHPELGLVSLEKSLAMYAWHGQHHVAHITSLRERTGW